MKLIPVALMFCASAAFAAPISVTLENGAGKVIGTAKIRAEKKGVVVHLTVEGLSPGVHAVHFHEKAVCTGPDFKSAGGHFNPEGKEHGLENP
ncbi:MAG: superoxide dismutase family protein, partial [Bdellovibrionota bacterium]